VLVSIDFENTRNLTTGFSEGDESQAGIAILDTHGLHYADPSDLISTYNLVTGSASYFEKSSKSFMFGEASSIQPAELLSCITSVIPAKRPIILVGHGFQVEVVIFARLGFNFAEDRISAIIDTGHLARQVLGVKSCSLRTLLRALGCPFNQLHSGGNDAHFTLQAALLLAIRSCQSTLPWISCERPHLQRSPTG
jgi:hypothetical protein